MKIAVCTALLLGSAVSCFSQAETLTVGEVRLSAQHQATTGSFRILDGHVRIETATVVIQADKATFDPATSGIEASGNVHITLKK